MPLTDKGYIRPSYDELLTKQINRAKTLFGNAINTNGNSIMGKFIRLNVSDFDLLYQDIEQVFYARFPNSASGQSLDRLLVFAGITRNPATAAKHLVRFYGTEGETLPMGFMVSTTEQKLLFYTSEEGTFVNGTCDVTVICDTPGEAGNVNIGAINSIVNPSATVDSIEHLALSEAGEDIESDTALRKRFTAALSGQGTSSVDAIRGAILRVPAVGGATVIENDSDYEKDGQPPHSFACYVLAPDDSNQLIAEAIFSKKPIGIPTVGELEFTVKDDSGTKRSIYFTKTSQKDIYIKATVLADSSFLKNTENGVAEIKENLIDKLDVYANGTTVYLSSLYKPISIDGVVNVASLTLSTDGVIYQAGDISCSFREVARTDVSKIEIEVLDIGE